MTSVLLVRRGKESDVGVVGSIRKEQRSQDEDYEPWFVLVFLVGESAEVMLELLVPSSAQTTHRRARRNVPRPAEKAFALPAQSPCRRKRMT